MIRNKYSAKWFLIELATVAVGLVFLAPFYFLVTNSFKSFRVILLDAASLPNPFTTENYKKVWSIISFPNIALHSFSITVASVLMIVLLSSMTAYRLVRRPTMFNKFLFGLFISAMIIPFQSIMLQVVKVAALMGLLNQFYGIVVCYIGFGMPLAMFLFHGFIKSVPLEIEEAAIVDGCSTYTVFFRIVFPLVRPIVVTVIILNVLWIWNDYLLPVLIIGNNESLRTIPLAVQSFFGQYTKKWDLAMAALTLSVTPVVAFFLLLQKHVIEGVTQGAIKT